MFVQLLVPLLVALVVWMVAWTIGKYFAGWRAGYLPEQQASREVPVRGVQLDLLALWVTLGHAVLQLTLLLVIVYLPNRAYPMWWYQWVYLGWVVLSAALTRGAFWEGYYGSEASADTNQKG